MLVRRNALGGTSPCAPESPPAAPAPATRPAGFQPIGQNGLRAPKSSWNDDLFLRVIAIGPSAGLFLASAGAAFWAGAVFVAGVAFSAAANNAGLNATDRQRHRLKVFIFFRSRWWRQFPPVEIGIHLERRECSIW